MQAGTEVPVNIIFVVRNYVNSMFLEDDLPAKCQLHSVDWVASQMKKSTHNSSYALEVLSQGFTWCLVAKQDDML